MSSKWEQIKAAVRRRDNNTCQNCHTVWKPIISPSTKKVVRNFHVHHMIGEHEGAGWNPGPASAKFQDEPLYNLITLCPQCHSQLTALRRKMGLIKHNMAGENFKTTDIYLAAFLISRGIVCDSIDATNPNRQVFVLSYADHLTKAISDFQQPGVVSVDIRRFIYALRDLKWKLNNR